MEELNATINTFICDLENKVCQLEKEGSDYHDSLNYLKEVNYSSEKTLLEMDEIISPFLTILSIIGNRITDGYYSTSDFDKDIHNLKLLLDTKGMKLSYFARGSKFSNDDLFDTVPSNFVSTDDPNLDSTVARCDSIGYSMESLNLKRNGKISLYKYDLKE